LFGALFLLLSMILIGIPFLLGYTLEIARNVHRGDPYPLPEWSNLGEKFVDGLKLIIVYLVWAIPIILLYCCQIALTIGLSAALGGGNRQAADAAGALLTIVTLGLNCLMGLYAIFVALVRPAIVVQYLRTGEIGAGFRFGEVLGIVRRIPGPVILTALLGIVAGFIGQLGALACFIGVFFTFAYAYFVTAHLEGQVWIELDRAPAA
jgi:hypothetical protein